LEAERIAQPDLFVVSNTEWARVLAEGFPGRSMLLAVEVLSQSSTRYDRVSKQPLYTRHVPEYWIIDPDARLVERWRTGDTRPEMVTRNLEWQPSRTVPPLVIDLPRFFASALGDPIGPPPRPNMVRERPAGPYSTDFDVREWLAQLPRHGWTRAKLKDLPEQFRFEIIDGELLLPDYVFDTRIPTPEE
jgi:hypothetical protein